MIPFNYHHLYYFYTIAKTGSITKACDTLRLAQPTLSAQLKQFENYLKVKLFEREKKKLILTEEGRQILFYATEIFDVGREMMDRIDDHSYKGRINIQIGVVHPVAHVVAAVRAAALGDLILMMRKNQVSASGMNIKRISL